MGSFGSGRKGGFGTTEGALTLDLARCMKLQQFRAGSHVQGKITWTMSTSGRKVASISYSADMRDPENAWVRLVYSTMSQGERAEMDYRVELTTTRPHFGGVRWWFVCPASGQRVRCLHSVGHCDVFAGRRFLRLGYQGQRENWSDQRLRAARVADARLGGNGCLLEVVPIKPKWMRWPTYWRLVQKRDRANLKSLISAIAAFDTPGARQIVEDARRSDPELLSGMPTR